MKLIWSAQRYKMVLESAREHQLVLDTLIEALYVVDRLPDFECVARLGRTKAEGQILIDNWRESWKSRDLTVADLEFVRACFLETLDFFSEADYQFRTGWAKTEAQEVFMAILNDRKKITIERLWG